MLSLYNNIAAIHVFVVCAVFAWLFGGIRGEFLPPVMPWVTAFLLEAMVCFPQRHEGETTYDARTRVWKAMRRDPLVWVSLAFIVLLMVPFFNTGLCPACDYPKILTGADPKPPLPILPFCVSRIEHLNVVMWFVPALVAMVATKHALQKQGKRTLLEMIVWNGFALAVLGVIQQAFEAPGPLWHDDLKGVYFFSTFGYPNMAADYFTTLFGIAVGLWRWNLEEVRRSEVSVSSHSSHSRSSSSRKSSAPAAVPSPAPAEAPSAAPAEAQSAAPAVDSPAPAVAMSGQTASPAAGEASAGHHHHHHHHHSHRVDARPKRTGHFWRKHYLLIPSVFFYVAALDTLSRAAVLLATGLAIIFFLHTFICFFAKMKRAKRVKFGALCVLVLAVIAVCAFFFMPEDLQKEVDTINTSEVLDRVTGRGQYHVRVATQIWKEHALFGVGGWGYKHFCLQYMTDKELREIQKVGGINVHNDHLQFLAEHGIVGFGLLATIVILLLAPLVNIWRALVASVRFIPTKEQPPQPIQIFVLPAPVFCILATSAATFVHAFGDCPLRSPAVLTLLYVSLAAMDGFLPRLRKEKDE